MRALALLPLALLLLGAAPAKRPPVAPRAITLPTDEPEFPAGPDQGLLAGNCTGCHSAEFVTRQPKLSRETWAVEVTKMRSVYGAPIDPADDAAIIAALARLQTH